MAMDRNVRIAKDLIRLAKSLVALDEEGDGSGFQRLHDVANFQEEEQEREVQKITQSLQNSIDESQRKIEEGAKAGKKYILIWKVGGLWRIVACRDFGMVKKGDQGGLVKSEDNLSQDGKCWIWHDALVYDNARVADNASVYGCARVYGNANVYNDAKVYGDAEVYGNARIGDDAVVCGSTKVYGNADVCGDAKIYESAQVYGNAFVIDNAEIYGKSKICGDATVKGRSKVFGYVHVDYDVIDDAVSNSRRGQFTMDQKEEYQKFIKSKMPALENAIRSKFAQMPDVHFIERLGWYDWGGIGFDVDYNGTVETFYIGYNYPDDGEFDNPWYAGFSVGRWEQDAFESKSFDEALKDLVTLIENHQENQM